MDKSRDVRRVLSRYSGHNRIDSKKKLVISELSGGGTVFAVKSRREKRRRLSLVERSSGGGCEDVQGTQMGSGKSDSQDDELPFSTVFVKKLKSQKKIDCNGVDRDSIPRKLRSVIKKRTCHNISEPLPNPKNHVNSLQKPEKDCLKKLKSGLFNPEQMSKDEEEVAETLYALAGMVPRKVTSLENKSDGESPSERQVHSKKLDDSLLSSQGPQASDEAAEETCNQISEELLNQKMEVVDDLGKSTPFSPPKLSETVLNLNASLQVNHQSLTKTCSETKHEHVSIGSKKNGSTLLPRIYSQASHASGADDGFPSQYSATKLPYWLHTVASSSEPGLHHSQVSHKNVSKIENHSRWIKNRCATHVYISKFIQLSQKPQGKEISLVETRPFKPSEGVTFGVLNPVSNESTITVPDSRICSSSPAPGKNIQDATNDTLITLGRCSHGQEHASLAPGNSILPKRSFDFLSLSTGGSGKEHRVDANNRNRIQLDPLAGLPVPQLQTLTRYDSVATLPLPPNHIQLNAYQNLHSTSAKSPLSQVHLQLPPYFTRSNQMDGNATSITKQPQLQPRPPQQHSVWMTQPATQCTQAQIAHWQNSRQEPQILQYKPAQIPLSHCSLPPGAHFPKYFQMPQQNHQMLRISGPFPPNQANSQHSTVPIWCDKSGS